MLRLAADENFNNDIVRGLLRNRRTIDIVRIQDTEVTGAADPVILEWAALEGRILVTHDGRTVPPYAYERIRAGLAMPGIIEVDPDLAIGLAIDDLLLLNECSLDDEWNGRICYIPLRN